jgi:hypothetical protein|tara:strand:- start:70 stop:225 length:156 start_codon:yes stop_codon:yes gene_type:complete
MPNKYVVRDSDIIRVFLRNSHSIKSVARSLGVPVSYAGKVINLYKKKHGFR